MYYIICDTKPEEFITKINQKKKSIKQKSLPPPQKKKLDKKKNKKQTDTAKDYMDSVTKL